MYAAELDLAVPNLGECIETALAVLSAMLPCLCVPVEPAVYILQIWYNLVVSAVSTGFVV